MVWKHLKICDVSVKRELTTTCTHLTFVQPGDCVSRPAPGDADCWRACSLLLRVPSGFLPQKLI